VSAASTRVASVDVLRAAAHMRSHASAMSAERRGARAERRAFTMPRHRPAAIVPPQNSFERAI